MGGAIARCPTYVNRDNKVMCLHSKDDEAKWIKDSGQAFRVDIIQGCYSFGSLSANTHAGGGCYDTEADGYAKQLIINECKRLRDMGNYAMPRFWKGNWHIHWADASCPSMSAQLAAQFVLFGKGYDGLVGNNPDPLGGYGKDRIMARFNSRFNTVTVPPTTSYTQTGGYYTVRSGDTVSKIAAAFRVTIAQIQTWNKLSNVNNITVGQKLRVIAPVVVAKPVNYGYPYTYKQGWYPYPGRQGASYYGPSVAGNPWYSGKTAGGTKTGVGATGGLALSWVRAHIQRIQRCAGTTIDGRYGAQTVEAVKRWQKAHGLSADGIVGPRTWQAMAKSRGQ